MVRLAQLLDVPEVPRLCNLYYPTLGEVCFGEFVEVAW